MHLTQEEFTAFYPQFAGFTPAAVLSEYIRQANARFSRFPGADAEEARRLYTAHKLTLYAGASPPEGAAFTKAQLAEVGGTRRVASKKAGEVAVTYSSGASSSFSVSSGLADLAETAFGLQLLSLIRLYGRSMYVP